MTLPSFVAAARTQLRLLALLLTLGVTSALAVSTDLGADQLLASELPPGIALQVASLDQVIAATRKAVRRHPRRVVGVVRAAILSGARRRRPAEGKNVVDRSKESLCPPCEFVVGVARAAIEANVGQASAIVEEASGLCPACAGDLQALLSDPGLAALGGEDGFTDGPFGFGFGLGPGFPGGPVAAGGQPTSGVLSLSPVGSIVTPVTNP